MDSKTVTKQEKVVNEFDLLKEAEIIGNYIHSKVRTGNGTFFWESYEIDFSNRVVKSKSDNIYSGNAGIVLFLIELFKSTCNDKFLVMSKKSMDSILKTDQKSSNDNYSFLIGKFGVAYTLLKLYQTSNEATYLEQCLKIVEEFDKNFDRMNYPNEYLYGYSGMIIPLLHIFAQTNEIFILETVNRVAGKLIENMNSWGSGIYWDRNYSSIKPLCGFSHGVSGISFVLLEMGKYFNNKSFYLLAEQAMFYERNLFNRRTMSWPDLRKDVSTEKKYKSFEKDLINGEYQNFYQPKYLDNWCNGSSGIGLVRLRAYELLKDDIFQKELLKAYNRNLKICFNQKYKSYILCHGKCGNADLFLEMYKLFNNQEYLKLAEKVTWDSIRYKNANGFYITGISSLGKKSMREDLNLFMGIAGIGYSYLRTLDPQKTPSILYPVLNEPSKIDLTNYEYLNISESKMRESIVSTRFPQTMILSKLVFPAKAISYLAREVKTFNENEIFCYESLIKKECNQQTNYSKFLKNIFQFENAKSAFNYNIRSLLVLKIKEDYIVKNSYKLLKLKKSAFVKLFLVLNEDIKIIRTKLNPNIEIKEDYIETLIKGEEEFIILLKRNYEKMEQIELKENSLSYYLIKNFSKQKSIETIIRILEQKIGIENNQRLKFKKLLCQQISILINSQILIKAKDG